MSHFFTRTGDDGYSGLLGEKRVPKYDPRLQALGDIDEVSAAVGLARSVCTNETIADVLVEIQRDPYHVMAEIAATRENAARFRQIDSGKVEWLESQVDLFSQTVVLPSDFILPGDSTPGAMFSLARAITRRAERSLTWLIHQHEVENVDLTIYLNRLPSFLFIIELIENKSSTNQPPTLAKK